MFLLFHLGKDRYVLEARHVIEVLPLLELKKIPEAPRGVAGMFSYRGRPVPAIDLNELTLGQPAAQCLSTRIIIINYPDESGRLHPLGLIAERICHGNHPPRSFGISTPARFEIRRYSLPWLRF